MPHFEQFHQIQCNGEKKIRIARVYEGSLLTSAGDIHKGLILEFSKDGKLYLTGLTPDDATGIAAILVQGAIHMYKKETE